MRLWHKDLIHVLPNKQLIAQWRECCAIMGEIDKHGFPKSPLTKPIVDYPLSHFRHYVDMVLDEMQLRGIKVSGKAYQKFVKRCDRNMDKFYRGIRIGDDIYKYWHSDRYLKQCFYNLQEKYDRGMMSDEDWTKIVEKTKGLI